MPGVIVLHGESPFFRLNARPFYREAVRIETKYPNYAMNVGHQGEYAAIAGAAHIAKQEAWTLSPLFKITFADPSLTFDFSEIRREFAKGAIREFMPSVHHLGVLFLVFLSQHVVFD